VRHNVLQNNTCNNEGLGAVFYVTAFTDIKIIAQMSVMDRQPKKEFLNINLTKDSSLLLLVFTVSFKVNHTLFWFKKSFKKNRETRKLESIHE
jgi:hypothetical protein